MRVAGQLGQSFVLQASIDLHAWENIVTDTVLDSWALVIDEQAAIYPHRFYRVAPLDSLLPGQPLKIQNLAERSDSDFVLKLQGKLGQGYRLEASTNLMNWIDVGSGIIDGHSDEFTDSTSHLFPARFYRLLPVP